MDLHLVRDLPDDDSPVAVGAADVVLRGVHEEEKLFVLDVRQFALKLIMNEFVFGVNQVDRSIGGEDEQGVLEGGHDEAKHSMGREMNAFDIDLFVLNIVIEEQSPTGSPRNEKELSILAESKL